MTSRRSAVRSSPGTAFFIEVEGFFRLLRLFIYSRTRKIGVAGGEPSLHAAWFHDPTRLRWTSIELVIMCLFSQIGSHGDWANSLLDSKVERSICIAVVNNVPRLAVTVTGQTFGLKSISLLKTFENVHQCLLFAMAPNYPGDDLPAYAVAPSIGDGNKNNKYALLPTPRCPRKTDRQRNGVRHHRRRNAEQTNPSLHGLNVQAPEFIPGANPAMGNFEQNCSSLYYNQWNPSVNNTPYNLSPYYPSINPGPCNPSSYYGIPDIHPGPWTPATPNQMLVSGHYDAATEINPQAQIQAQQDFGMDGRGDGQVPNEQMLETIAK
ncbi:hypothetical protein EGW08_018367 [Elysia chlorotica]|uniref:Uncharacterized protein n=1 Tax=Elysia chlorotica TaxID=188477 RepID=A0A433SX38_ELYCH|nr:hypothetical protein EGW08_018367 [Elysia chlorotica]